MSQFTAEDLARLKAWDTPTICNGLEIVSPERRGTGFTIRPFSVLDPDLPPICGVVCTARLRAAAPDPTAKGMASRLPYYEYVATGDLPRVLVIQDLDPAPGIGAFWGEVHTTVHLGLGIEGCVTNGGYRDVTDSAKGFQILGGSVCPSHAHVHVVDFGGPVEVHGMEAHDGDVVHADRHGAVIVPAEAVRALPDAIDLITRKEAVILNAAREPGFDFAALKAAIGDQADIH